MQIGLFLHTRIIAVKSSASDKILFKSIAKNNDYFFEMQKSKILSIKKLNR